VPSEARSAKEGRRTKAPPFRSSPRNRPRRSGAAQSSGLQPAGSPFGVERLAPERGRKSFRSKLGDPPRGNRRHGSVVAPRVRRSMAAITQLRHEARPAIQRLRPYSRGRRAKTCGYARAADSARVS
jgi:hypothetical protein